MRDLLGPEGTYYLYAFMEVTLMKKEVGHQLKCMQLKRRLRFAMYRLREMGYKVQSVTEVRNSRGDTQGT